MLTNPAISYSITYINSGYGHQSPLSYEGKVFCMLYAVVGIPMTLLLLSAVVERALIPISRALSWMQDRSGGRQPIYVCIAHFGLVVLISKQQHAYVS